MRRISDVSIRSRLTCLVATLFIFTSSSALSDEWKAVWGDLHSHTSLSDGAGTPSQAFEYAARHCQYLALTEHNHLIDESKLDTLLKESEEEYDDFIPVFGQEFSVLSKGNHLNVFNIRELIPKKMNSDYRALYSEWLPNYQKKHPNDIILCQFNHPANLSKDYGISSFGTIENYEDDWSRFVADADRWVRLIAVVNGPGTHTKGQHDFHADISKDVKTWFFYLDKGMHLSPTCNHDTHVESWGDLTTARTGVWLNAAYSRENLLKALKAGRCFATEDKNLSVWFSVNGMPMGTQLRDMGTADLKVKVRINDEDEPDSNYRVEIYRDIVGDGDLAEKIWDSNAKCGQELTTTIKHQRGVLESLLVHVEQTDECDDVDDAWTAPVYIGGVNAKTASEDEDKNVQSAPTDYEFVGSIKSKVYHYPSCKSVKAIKPENLQQYPSAPEGKTLHKGCPVE